MFAVLEGVVRSLHGDAPFNDRHTEKAARLLHGALHDKGKVPCAVLAVFVGQIAVKQQGFPRRNRQPPFGKFV